MKHLNILLFLLIVLGWQTASAYDFMVDGLCYNYNDDGASVTVTYKGYQQPYIGGNLIIPEIVTYNEKTYVVNSIGQDAFYDCSGLTSVTIPNSVISICAYAFVRCTNLESVTIGNSVTSIGYRAFYYCTGLTSITIGNSVELIGDDAFYYCSSLTSLTIPNSVTSIGKSAFERCWSLASVSIPNSVISVGDNAFESTTWLNNQPDGLVYAGMVALKYHGTMPEGTSIVLKNGCTQIAASAFSGCFGLLSVTIPNSVTSIGNGAFGGCTGLTSITIPNSVISIGKEAFVGCSGLTTVTIPNSVSYIGSYAFSTCSGLESVIWNAKTCNNFDTSPFSGCNIFSFTFGNEVEMIPECLCYKLTCLTSISIGNSVKAIGSLAFSGCTRLANIYCHVINPHTISIGIGVFNDVNKSSCILTVPAVSLDLYKNHYYWDDFYNILPDVFVDSIILSKNQLPLYYGQIDTLYASVSPSNAYSVVNWTSSNSSIVTVDQNGVVIAKKIGMATIKSTATDGSGVYALCEVTVSGIEDITLNKTETFIYAGGTEQLTAIVFPSDVINNNLTWSSSNTNVAIVNQNGIVTAKNVGQAVITATATDGSGVSASCAVTVMGITSLTLDKHDLTLDIEATGTLNATVEPQEAINKNLTWRSLNTSVVAVTNTGVVTPKGVGSTKIIVQTTDGSNLSDTCVVTVIPAYDLYPTTTELTHVRGQSDFSAVIPFWMSNKTAISGLQFDITLPTGVTFATVDDYPDVWLDPTRKARNHSVDVNLISGSRYRVLVASPTNNTFKGNEGEVLYMRFNIDSAHPIGSYYINTSNVIFVEPDETQHNGYNKSVQINYKYLLGDADGDARVDVADYTVTALYILNRPTEVFYSDAANVSGDNGINVTDLVGITNISLGIRPHEYRPAPAITMDNETQESMPSLNASMEGDNIVALSIDNDIPLAGIQLDLQLPQGMALSDATLEGRAVNYQLGTNTLADGSVRLLISSFGSNDIKAGNDAVIKLVLAGDNVNNEMLYITGAQAASRDLRSYELNDVTLPVGTTSIDDIGYSYDKLSIYGKGNTIVVNSPSAMTVQLVHVNGMVMPVEIKPGHNTIEVGGHGVYIIRVGNNVYKVRL